MNASKILIAFGVLMLAIAAVFASTKKRATTVYTVFYTKVSFCYTFKSLSGQFTTAALGGDQASIRTVSGSTKPLWSSCSNGFGGINPVYFNP
jgi:hypothetical protein